MLFGFLGTGVGLILPFAVRTVLLYRYGTEYLGLNGVFQSIISVLNLAELGFSSSIVFSLYKPIAENDDDTVNAYLAYFRKIYIGIGLIICIAGFASLPFLHFFIKDPTMPGNLNCYIWYLFFLSEAVISYVFYGYKFVIPTALQRNDIIHRVSMIATTMKAVLQILALLYGSHYFIYLAMSPLMTMVHYFILSRIVSKEFPQYKPKGMINESQKAELKPMLAGIMIHKIRGVSRNSFDNLCISTFVGLNAAGIYQNYLFVMTSVTSAFVIITSSMLSGVGNSIVTDSKEKNYHDMCRFDFMYMLLAGWASICLVCLYQPFMELWAGPSRMLGMPEVIMIVMYFYLLHLGNMRWTYTEGAGLWWKGRYIAVAESIANLIMNVLFVRWLGVFGIILATLLSLIIVDNVFGSRIVFDYYFQNGKLGEYWRSQFRYLLVSGIVCAVTYFVCGRIPISGFPGLFIKLMICVLIPVPGYYLIYRKTPVFREAKDWIMSFIRKKRGIEAI